MSSTSSRPLPPALLASLNALLAALALPFTLDHPTDLTPSLLLAVFESLISARLPIPASVRQSRTRDAKARAMLVLLGVLECDILRGGTDSSNADDSVLGVSVDGWVDEIGLGEIDPEQLADGGWDETIFVGELLCWLARRRGILPRTTSARRSRSLYSSHHHSYDGDDTADFSTSLLLRPSPAPDYLDDTNADMSHVTDVPRHPLVHSPEPSVSASATTGTDLSIRAHTVSSRTSVHDDQHEFDEPSHAYDPRQMMQDAHDDDDQPPSFRPRCIHELEDPSYIQALAASLDRMSTSQEDDQEQERDNDNDDLYAPSTPTPRRVRLTGWIDTVDAAAELSHFAASRASPSFRSQPRARVRPTPRHMSPSPPPSPSPSPPPTSRMPPSRSPSPPSPPAHSDPPFDVSFSTPNNTSTPAKPRPRRPQLQLQSQHRHQNSPGNSTKIRPGSVRTMVTAVETGIEMEGGSEMGTGTGANARTRTDGTRPTTRHDRSPSYTPSPPSFSTGGSGGGGVSSATRRLATGGLAGSRSGSGSTPVPRGRTRDSVSPPTLPSSSVRGYCQGQAKSPPLGSTTTTSTLLTERARLLTELAALKRARAASSSGVGVGSSSSSSGGQHRIRVGV